MDRRIYRIGFPYSVPFRGGPRQDRALYWRALGASMQAPGNACRSPIKRRHARLRIRRRDIVWIHAVL